MSQDQFGKTTRRAFLGTATVATAATLTAPVAGEAQAADQVLRRHDQTGASECGCSRTADVTCQSGRLDKAGGYGNPERGIFQA